MKRQYGPLLFFQSFGKLTRKSNHRANYSSREASDGLMQQRSTRGFRHGRCNNMKVDGLEAHRRVGSSRQARNEKTKERFQSNPEDQYQTDSYYSLAYELLHITADEYTIADMNHLPILPHILWYNRKRRELRACFVQ